MYCLTNHGHLRVSERSLTHSCSVGSGRESSMFTNTKPAERVQEILLPVQIGVLYHVDSNQNQISLTSVLHWVMIGITAVLEFLCQFN